MTKDEWMRFGSLGVAPYLPTFSDPMSANCNVHPYYTGSIQSQLSLIMEKLTRLEAENEELKKAVAELAQLRYFD